jgi:alginate O-acetyltransferase complex protein AlgI
MVSGWCFGGLGMLFNSLEFLFFLPIVLSIYFLLPHRGQNRFLLAASCFFYACWDWRFLFPLLASTCIDYYCATRIEQSHLNGEPQQRRKPFLILSLVTNLGLLGFFKYCNFFADNFRHLATAIGWQLSPWTLDVILPVGISFYTFQALSYTIDVYRGQLHATTSFADFLLGVLYFPHLVAGPIQRASNLLAQVNTPRRVTRQHWIDGLHLIFWGFFKKVFIADNLAPLVDQIFKNDAPPGGAVWLATYAFAIQIYCDFSGYTDIARGVAKLMGFEFVLNFNLPYLATSPQEFWTRWHISLSSWLRDYLYIPLGGNRGGPWKTNRNLLLTMVIGGFWHGAAWNFILWGAYHGLLLVTHRLTGPWVDRMLRWTGPSTAGRGLSWGLRWVVMLHLTCYGWLLFRAHSWEQIVGMTRALASPSVGFDASLAWQVASFSLPLLAVQVVQYVSGKLDFLSFSWMPAEVRVVCYSVIVYFVVFRGGQPQSFIYFQF